MAEDITLAAPISPHEMDKAMRAGMEDLCRRVTLKAAVEGCGASLTLRIYMAGLYHGATLGGRMDNPKMEIRPYEC